MPSWITCQLGAREHYAIPRALHQTHQLRTLITDAWVTPNSALKNLPGKTSRALAERFHSDLSTASITAFTPALIRYELQQRLSRTTGWSSILNRNRWFQHQALKVLRRIPSNSYPNQHPILFSYSYTALNLFRYAKQQGWKTILGQIDPGPQEEQLVAQLQAQYGKKYNSTWTPAPKAYWQTWHQECELADQIIVNSTWSYDALTQAGILGRKITILPLAYHPPTAAQSFTRQYPETFNHQRPLRVLFLGQIILRKGIIALLEAVEQLQHQPVEFWLVGSSELHLTERLSQLPNVKLFGAVPRSQVQQYYQQADVFLFPTHSDGFGLTQLEAQAWHLPIIASQHCGAVVNHQQNGLILPQASGNAIKAALLQCVQHPHQLWQWSQQATPMQPYSLNSLAKSLQQLADAPFTSNEFTKRC